MSHAALSVAFLKMKLVSMYLSFDAGDAQAMGRAISLVDVLRLLTGDPFVDFTLAVYVRAEADATGARSTRMDKATDGLHDAFEALALRFEREIAEVSTEPFDPASHDLGVGAERARWTWKTDAEIEAAIRVAAPHGRKVAISWLAGTVNEAFTEASYTGPRIPPTVLAAVLGRMVKAAEVEPGKWAIAE